MEEKRLTSSGWTARWMPGRVTALYLDYEGVEYKRSQSIIRYSSGQFG